MRVLSVLVTLLLVAGCTPVDDVPSAASPAPSAPPAAAGDAAGQLRALAVVGAGSMAGYSREKFPHWRRVDENCDVRDAVLKRDGTGVEATATCKVTKGTWVSVYDDRTFTDPAQVDIDHMVPLANAWRSGASAWPEDRRTEFANDLTRPQLMAVSRASNRAKGDQDPSQWKPASRGYWCEYARRWIAVKSFWGLTVTDREKSALGEMLGTCRPPRS